MLVIISFLHTDTVVIILSFLYTVTVVIIITFLNTVAINTIIIISRYIFVVLWTPLVAADFSNSWMFSRRSKSSYFRFNTGSAFVYA
jgi:hypothetical protein